MISNIKIDRYVQWAPLIKSDHGHCHLHTLQTLKIRSRSLSHGALSGSRGCRELSPLYLSGNETRLTKFGKLTQDRRQPDLTPET